MLICSYILLPAFLALDLEVVAIAAEMGVLLCKNQSQREFGIRFQQAAANPDNPSSVYLLFLSNSVSVTALCYGVGAGSILRFSCACGHL